MQRVAAISTAMTELKTSWANAQHIDLISAVVSQIFKGTGLTLDDVDFVFDSGSDVLDGRSISNCGFLGALGAHHKEESRVEEDGLWAANYGVAKIASGAADVGLIVAYSKPSESDPEKFYSSQVEPFYQRPVGFDHLAASGFQAQRYMASSRVEREALAGLVCRRWDAANRCGRVQIGHVPTVDEVLSAEEVALPLTRLMMARPVDGAVAVLIASEQVARRSTPIPAWITGMGYAMDSHAFAARKPNSLQACELAAQRAYRNAGWKRAPKEVCIEASASSAVTELLVLEALGLAGSGNGMEFASDPDAVVNRSGGALPADPIMATGLVRLSETYRLMTQSSNFGLKSIPKAAVVHGAGGVGMQTHCVFTLEI